MASKQASLTKAQVAAAVAELDALSKSEYGLPLEQLLLDDSPLAAQRMQRLTGIVLKQKFARRSGPARYGSTGAKHSWPWAGSPASAAKSAPKEFEILGELRKPGPWNERKPKATPQDPESSTWDEFRDDVEHERGLFKVLALYVNDRINAREKKSIREYLESKETRKFEAGLDLATLVFDAAITGPVAALLGLPTLAVGVALVGMQYGYRKFTDPNEDRMGDHEGESP